MAYQKIIHFVMDHTHLAEAMDYNLLKKEIHNILFEEGKTIGIHKLYNNNFIIDIDYEKISNLIIEAIKEHNAKTSN